jgi:uncharacterized protein HemX
MSAENQFGKRPETDYEERGVMNTSEEFAAQDAEVKQALANFRSSVHAWSEATYSRPRAVEMTARRRRWRLAAGLTLASALVAGTVAGGVWEHQQQQGAARVAAQQAREQQLEAAQERARQADRKLMTSVDSEISQQVPSAMEPLAQMMVTDEETQ